MRKIIVTISAMLLAGLVAANTWAETVATSAGGTTAAATTASTTAPTGWKRSIHIEWGYTKPADIAVTGFRLYQNGTRVCEFAGPDTSQGDCEVLLTRRGTEFTLTAVFADGTESPHSAPFVFADFGPGPKIVIMVGK
jgi:hypothetical protein